MIIAIAIVLLTRTEYVPLATNLSLEEAANITTNLTELGISHRDEDNTTTILVPKEDLSRAKMQLTLNGSLTAKDFNWTQALAIHLLHTHLRIRTKCTSLRRKQLLPRP